MATSTASQRATSHGPRMFPRFNVNPKYFPRSVWKGGADGTYGPDWRKMWDPTRPTDTNPLGVIIPPGLKDELRKYADLNQVTKDEYKKHDNTGTVEGFPEILDPSQLIKPSMWLIEKKSAAYKYEIPDNDIFYIVASSGIYPDLSDIFDDVTTNWIGYVAISKGDEDGKDRDVVIAFRGTVEESEWWSDFQPEMVRWNDLEDGAPARTALLSYGLPLLKRFYPEQVVMVAKGFEQMYRHFTSTPGNSISVQGQVHVALHKLLAAYPGKISSITITGHSLGGALASMCAFDIATSHINRDGDTQFGMYIPVTAITFEAPQVGNQKYAERFNAQKPVGDAETMAKWADLKMLRVVNKPDLVPKMPKWNLTMRWLNVWRWGELVKHYLFDDLIVRQLFPQLWESTTNYHHGGTEYTVDSTHVEKTTLQDYKKQIFLFVRHNMQLAKHLCCNPGQPFKPADLDGPDNHDASTTNLNHLPLYKARFLLRARQRLMHTSSKQHHT